MAILGKNEKKKKVKRYDISALKQVSAQYKPILGERSNGKSYQVKKECMTYAWNENNIYVYLRRYLEDIKTDKVVGIKGYFRDMEINDDGISEVKELTNNECDTFVMYRGVVYFATTLPDGKLKRVKPMCICLCLAQHEHYKSMALVKVNLMLFEEFIAPLNQPFLPREFSAFMSIVSTVFRRRDGVVYMIANTTKVVCPYFDEWGITAKTLEKGKITVFHHESQDIDDETGKPIITDIAVEYTDNAEGSSKMFTGKNRSMIMSGEWDTNSYPHLDGKLTKYQTWYMIYIHINNQRFIMRVLTEKEPENGKIYPFLYVYPYTKDRNFDKDDCVRKIGNHFLLDPMYSNSFAVYRTKYDKLVHKMLKEGRIVFSDNMTGTTFYECVKNTRDVI